MTTGITAFHCWSTEIQPWYEEHNDHDRTLLPRPSNYEQICKNRIKHLWDTKVFRSFYQHGAAALRWSMVCRHNWFTLTSAWKRETSGESRSLLQDGSDPTEWIHVQTSSVKHITLLLTDACCDLEMRRFQTEDESLSFTRVMSQWSRQEGVAPRSCKTPD